MRIRLLLVDPVEEFLKSDAEALENSGFKVMKAGGIDSMPGILARKAIDIILFALDDNGDPEYLNKLKKLLSGFPVSLIFRANESRPSLLKESEDIPSDGYVSRSGISSVMIASILGTYNRNALLNKKLETLEKEKELFNLFLENCPEYVFFKDDEIKTVKLSRNYEKMLGKPLSELLGKTMFELFPSDLGASMDADDRVLLKKGAPFEVEEELNGKHYLTRKFPLKGKNNSTYLAGFTIDITRRVEAEKKLEELATKDSLTGLFNRRQILHLGEVVLKDSIRSGVPLGILMLDVDFFKNYNDTYGHQAGDSCLVKAAGIMSHILSRNNDLTGRYGGEEFVAILFNTDRESLQILSQRICRQFMSARIPHSSSSVSGFVTVSIGGISVIPNDKTTLHELIKVADDALYRAKTAGRNRSVII